MFVNDERYVLLYFLYNYVIYEYYVVQNKTVIFLSRNK